MLNLTHLLNTPLLEKTSLNSQKNLKPKLKKIHMTYLISKVVSNIIESDKKIKIDVRLVKNVRDNVELMGGFMKKEIMNNPRGVKKLMYNIINPRKKIVKKRFKKYRAKRNVKLYKASFSPTWLS